jgi:hypothetical protein
MSNVKKMAATQKQLDFIKARRDDPDWSRRLTAAKNFADMSLANGRFDERLEQEVRKILAEKGF